MHNQWAGMNATLSNATVSKTWLHQMGAGADSVGINILYPLRGMCIIRIHQLLLLGVY